MNSLLQNHPSFGCLSGRAAVWLFRPAGIFQCNPTIRLLAVIHVFRVPPQPPPGRQWQTNAAISKDVLHDRRSKWLMKLALLPMTRRQPAEPTFQGSHQHRFATTIPALNIRAPRPRGLAKRDTESSAADTRSRGFLRR